ncbi:MAG: winged helix-turn-helix domain-containing protein [Bdellovibrionales bacterium]|nr:winged helix-turn-helix domain-containing protein [Bdellovibrionales bacterium]
MADSKAKWTFFSNHAHVYFLLARKSEIVMREIAQEVGITERAVQGIVDDLESEGYITKEPLGRTYRYHTVAGMSLRHKLELSVQLDDLTRIIKKTSKT